jgi:hypothetical protein
MRPLALLSALGLIVAITGTASLFMVEEQQDDRYRARVGYFIETEISSWINDPALLRSVQIAGSDNARLDEEAIMDREKLWLEEASAGSGRVIHSVMSSSLSARLMQIKNRSEGKIAEIIAMDDRGLTIGLSDVTSDYIQSDEDKWQRVFHDVPGSIFVDEVRFDASTSSYICQVSFVLTTSDGKPAGVITVGLNVDRL